MQKYDVIIIGSGPGGYVAAIRASQLGYKTAIVEKEHIGGVCLNWGCIPTKALLKSAQVAECIQHSEEYGIEATGKPNFEAVIKRSRNVAEKMNKGVAFLLKKNKIDILKGIGNLHSPHQVEVIDEPRVATIYEARHIILATGAYARHLASAKVEGKKIISYKEALTLPQLPKTMLVIGSGAIGMELAYFYHTMGTKVTIVEYMNRLVPQEDEEISKEIDRIYRKKGINILTDSNVEKCTVKGNKVIVQIKSSGAVCEMESEVVLSAIGITPNIEGIGLEKLSIAIEKGRVWVDDFYCTSQKSIYAIGDIIATPALAHVASHEGIICIEHIAYIEKRLDSPPLRLDYTNIPSCIYTTPEIASVGFTEKQAQEKGYDIKVGKFPFSASGKASASGANEGFVKIIYDAQYGELLGMHAIGMNVTEIIAEAVMGRKLETTSQEILSAVHAHPTIHEAIMEATAQAYGECIHL
ncbi:MAG: dihydrolipoyl dehydrogenase [Chitinophagaceae bacterium]